MLRYLRIARSVGWGITCLLLILLWVRSLTYWDQYLVQVSAGRSFHWQSASGAMVFAVPLNSRMDHGRVITASVEIWGMFSKELDKWQFRSPVWAGFDYDGGFLILPYWFLVTLSAVLCAAPFIKRTQRFSLRTLLIAMTLIAVGLGAIVYAIR